MVLVITVRPRRDSESTLPVSASNAREPRLRSPQNTRSPAVASAEPLAGCGCEWSTRISPVERSILARFMYFFGSMPGRMTPPRGPQPALLLRFAVMVTHWSWKGTYNELFLGL